MLLIATFEITNPKSAALPNFSGIHVCIHVYMYTYISDSEAAALDVSMREFLPNISRRSAIEAACVFGGIKATYVAAGCSA